MAENNFNFSNEVTEFTKQLGALCPDKYDYKIRKGDTLDISKGLLSFNIESPVVKKVLAPTGRMKKIINKLQDFEQVDKEDELFLEDNFFYWGKWHGKELYSSATICLVGFEQEITINSKIIKKINDKNVQDLIKNELVKNITFKLKNIDLTLVRIGRNKFKLSGSFKCFIDGDSVVTTQEMDDFKRMHQKQKVVENVAWSDNVLNGGTIKELNTILDAMCENEIEDYHPGSGSVVRDIVHPSLYPYIKGLSIVEDSILSDYKVVQDSNEDKYGETDFWGRVYEDSIYQWLPAEFFVSKDGKVSINSYINNLDREKYPKAYDLIGKVFEDILPMFETVCGSLRNDFYSFDKESKVVSVGLRERKLQVVTKIVEYKVNEEANFDGVWHVEGMSHENVLATGLCILKRDRNFSGAELEFRRYLFENEGNDLVYSTPQNANRPTDLMAGGDVRPLGTMETPNGRVIVFPNSHIHRVTKMSSKNGADAVRRILVFWLVNPESPIVSSANVKPQQNMISFGVAKKHRLALMRERKVHKEDFSEREVFLCEH